MTWRPYRADHPDAPELVVDSATERIPAETADAVLAWATATFDGRDPRIVATVTLDDTASSDEARFVQRMFDEAGVPAVVSAGLSRRSLDQGVPWIVMIEAPLLAFVTGLATTAGADAWRALKSLVTDLSEARRRATGRDGSVSLQDGSRTVILSEWVSDEGFREVAEGSLPEGGYYVWDTETRSWRRH